jgi:hypothetical protein
MPLAVAIVNGVRGLVKRAAGLASACCCKKWLCDPFTQTCTEDPTGPYTSEKQCNENCKRYACDLNINDCVEDPTGPYASLAECAADCIKRYKCNTDTYQCTEDPLGPYKTLKECEDNCKEDKYYCCGSPGTPEDRDCYTRPCSELGLDEFGVYDTPGECATACVAPHYACDPSTYTCYETPTGPYTDITLCEAECKPRYNCRTSDYTCVPDPNGPYLSVLECEQYCKAPTHYCCGSPGNPDDRDCYTQPCSELGLDDFGEYDSQEECDEKCKVDYYCCEDSEGNKFCSEDCEFDGANTVGGPYATSEECEKTCDPKKYKCETDSEGNKTCVESPDGEYDTSDCDGQCKPKRYSCKVLEDGSKMCVEDAEGFYETDDCDGDCPKAKYSCRDNGDGTSTCVEDPNGGYDDDACGGECDKKAYACVYSDEGIGDCVEAVGGEYDDDTCGGTCDKTYDCVPQPDGSTLCQEQRGGAFTEPTCGGGCDDNAFGACCTDYGLSSATRKQCRDWGGDFYTDYPTAVAACPCDCLPIGGSYCETNGLPCGLPIPPDSRCEGALAGIDGFEDYLSRQENYGGDPVASCFGIGCEPLAELLAKNALLTGWVDYANVTVTESSDDCCFGRSNSTTYKYRVFAYNCKKKEWEDAPNVLSQFDNTQVSRPDPTDKCINGTPLPRPPIPDSTPRAGRPVCLAPAPNPLP